MTKAAKPIIAIRNVRKTVTKRVITLDGIELPDDGLELLSEALQCDNYFAFIVITDQKLREALEKKGYIRTNSRGASYGTDKLRRVYKQVVKQLETLR